MPAITPVELLNQNTASEAGRTPSNELSGDNFMELFITQLRYQDPTSPMDTNQMLAQVTQLATMEGLANIQNQMVETFALNMLSAASDTVGKTVSYLDQDGAEQSGKVVKTTVNQGGAPLLTLEDGTAIPMDIIATIS